MSDRSVLQPMDCPEQGCGETWLLSTRVFIREADDLDEDGKRVFFMSYPDGVVEVVGGCEHAELLRAGAVMRIEVVA